MPRIALYRLLLSGALNEARVSRLTNPDVDTAGNTTFAVQYVDSEGRIVHEKSFEEIIGGKVYFGTGEAVLISK